MPAAYFMYESININLVQLLLLTPIYKIYKSGEKKLKSLIVDRGKNRQISESLPLLL